ncbi:low temperature requirement protein A [Streptacidiphilus monticola]
MTEESGESGITEKRVSWAELLFDLVFVLCVTQVSALLHAHHDWRGLLHAFVVLVPVYWTWVGTSVLADITDTETPRGRLGIFAIGLTGLFLALALPQAYGSRGLLFGAAYLAARWLLAAQIKLGEGTLVGPMGVGAFLTGPLLLAGGLVDGWPRTALWGVAAAADLATPLAVRRKLLHIPFHPQHLPERFGLFLIIALGETLVSIGIPVASSARVTAAELVAVTLAYVLVCALWWVYFHYAADAMRHAMRTAAVPTDIVRQVLSYGHLSLVTGVIGVAAGISAAVTHPDRLLGVQTAILLFGGTALYLATFEYTRYRMFRLHSTTRLAGAAGVAVAAPSPRCCPRPAAWP